MREPCECQAELGGIARIVEVSFVSSLKGAVDLKHQFFTALFLFVCCVHLYVCRLCINFQDLCASLLGDTSLLILLLTFISHFVIDFLSLEKL